MKKHITALCTILLVFMLGSCGSLHDATFSGSKTGDENHYDISFDILNTTYTHDLVMTQGERIRVHVEKESGTITVKIQKGQETPVYEGNGEVATDFYVTIQENGTYTVSVTGKKAKGRVTFQRQ